MNPRKLYLPPSLTTIGRLVDEVFDRHGQENPIYNDSEIRTGFIRYLFVASNILAKYLSTAEEPTDWIDKSGK